jgi:hypothetical protein
MHPLLRFSSQKIRLPEAEHEAGILGLIPTPLEPLVNKCHQ